jgi:hypothetical protein
LIKFGEDFSKNPVSAVKNLISLRYFYVQQQSTVTEPVKSTTDGTINKDTDAN